jgi:hypothetical protein
MVKAVLGRNNGLSANINKNNAGAQQVSVQTPSVNTVNTFKSLTDVNASNLNDGALIQYDASSEKFVTRNELETTTGTITFNGGAF